MTHEKVKCGESREASFNSDDVLRISGPVYILGVSGWVRLILKEDHVLDILFT